MFTERFWRSQKYENAYLHAYADLTAARAGIGAYMAYQYGWRWRRFPKDTGFAAVIGEEIDVVADSLHRRPRTP